MVKTTGLILAGALLFVGGCSSGEKKAAGSSADTTAPGTTTPSSKHKYAKVIEIAGVRVSEKGVGKLQVKFGVVNHSIADLGDVGLRVTLRSKGAKPDDPPLAEFPCKVTLGPEEWKEVTVDIPTKLRVYELPDWQFIQTSYEVTSPPM